jgi:hypothetical protein
MAQLKVADTKVKGPSDLEQALAGFGLGLSEINKVLQFVQQMKQRRAEHAETKRSNLAGEAATTEQLRLRGQEGASIDKYRESLAEIGRGQEGRAETTHLRGIAKEDRGLTEAQNRRDVLTGALGTLPGKGATAEERNIFQRNTDIAKANQAKTQEQITDDNEAIYKSIVDNLFFEGRDPRLETVAGMADRAPAGAVGTVTSELFPGAEGGTAGREMGTRDWLTAFVRGVATLRGMKDEWGTPLFTDEKEINDMAWQSIEFFMNQLGTQEPPADTSGVGGEEKKTGGGELKGGDVDADITALLSANPQLTEEQIGTLNLEEQAAKYGISAEELKKRLSILSLVSRSKMSQHLILLLVFS